MGNMLSDVDDSEGFTSVSTLNHKIFRQIQVLQFKSDPVLGSQFMKITTSFKGEDYQQFLRQYLYIQNRFKYDEIQPFIQHISGLIFEFPMESLAEQLLARRKEGKYFTQEEMWYMAYVLIQGYSAYLQIPQLCQQCRLSTENIFFGSNGQLKLSLHIIFAVQGGAWEKKTMSEQSKFHHKIVREIGNILLECSSLSFDDSIKIMDRQYSLEFCNFVRDMLEDNKSLQYFQNYYLQSKMGKSIKQSKIVHSRHTTQPLDQHRPSLKQSQLIVEHIPTNLIENKGKFQTFDKVSRIASVEESVIRSNDANTLCRQQRMDPENQFEQYQMYSEEKAQPNLQGPGFRPQQDPQVPQQQYQASLNPFNEINLQQSVNTQFTKSPKQPLSSPSPISKTRTQFELTTPSAQRIKIPDDFNKKFWNAIAASKEQVFIFQSRNQSLY